MAYSPEELLNDFVKATEHISNASNSIDKSWHNIANATEKLKGYAEAGPYAQLLKIIGKQGQIVSSMTRIRDAFFRPEWASTQTGFIGELGNLLRTRVAAAWMFVGLMIKEGAKWADEMSKHLLEGNMILDKRYAMLREIAGVQARTGASTEDLADATKAALKYGFDLRDNYGDVLEIVTKMKVGLTVSADTSAQIAATARRLGADIGVVADGIARVKADTALAAESAAQFAQEIGNAMALLGPTAGRNLGVVAEYVNRLEGAAQGLGFRAGTIKDLLIGFTKEEGFMGISTLGFSPAFLDDLEKTKKVTEGFVAYVEKQLAGTTGYQRVAVLQVLAQQFNTTTEVVGNARKIMEEYNRTQRSTTTLNEQWNAATKTFAGTWARLKNSFLGMLQGALLPFVKIVNKLIEPLAGATEWLAKTEAGLWGLRAALVAVAIGATWATAAKLKGLIPGLRGGQQMMLPGFGSPTIAMLKNFFGKALGFFQFTSGMWTKSLSLASASQGILTAMKGGWLSFGAGFLRVMGPIGAALAGGWFLGRLIGRVTGLDEHVQKGFTKMLDAWRGTQDFARETRVGAMGKYTLQRFYDDIIKAKRAGMSPEEIDKLAASRMARVDIIKMWSQEPKRQLKLLAALHERVADIERMEERRKQYTGVTAEEDRNRPLYEAQLQAIEDQTQSVDAVVAAQRQAFKWEQLMREKEALAREEDAETQALRSMAGRNESGRWR